MSESLGGDWWPYGPLADALANAVLKGDKDEVAHYVGRVKEERARAVKFGEIETRFYQAMEDMRWDEAKDCIDEMRLVGGLTQSAIVSHDTAWRYESSFGVLDRMAEIEPTDDEG